MEKTGRDRLTGPFQMDHHPKASLSSAYFLSSLMRMVAMRRMLEILLIIQLSNTSNGSCFNLVSTYLQIMRSGCPRYNQLGVTVRASHFGPIPRLSFHRGCVVSQYLVRSMPLPWQPLGLNFSDGRQRHPLCAHLLYRSMYIPLNVCQAQHGGSRSASQEYTVYNLIGKEKK